MTKSLSEITAMKHFLIWYKNDNVRLFRRQIFDKNVIDPHTGRRFQVKAGVEGQCDVYGFICRSRKLAIPLEIEFKGEKTRITKEQANWKSWCNRMGIPHVILRTPTDRVIDEIVEIWGSQLSEFIGAFL